MFSKMKKLTKVLDKVDQLKKDALGGVKDVLDGKMPGGPTNKLFLSTQAAATGVAAQSSFQTGDSVYVTFNLEKPAQEIFNGSPSIGFKLECNDDLINIPQHPTDRAHKNASSFALGPEDMGKTTLHFLLIPGDKADYTKLIKEDAFYPGVIARKLGNVPAGEHELVLTVMVAGARIKSTFSLNLAAGGGPGYYSAKVDELEARFAGESFKLPEAKMSDPELEAAMVKEMNTKDFQETFKWAHITSDWLIERKDNNKGAILRRTISAYMGSELNGKYHVQDMTFQQPYTGNNEFGSIMFKAIGSKYVIGKELFESK